LRTLHSQGGHLRQMSFATFSAHNIFLIFLFDSPMNHRFGKHHFLYQKEYSHIPNLYFGLQGLFSKHLKTIV
jgi:hypothetical protein